MKIIMLIIVKLIINNNSNDNNSNDRTIIIIVTWNYNEEIIALKQNGLKSIFFILRKQQINTWYSNNLSTISHELTILGHKRGNLACFENV